MNGQAGDALGDATSTYHPCRPDRTWSTTLAWAGTPGPVSAAAAADCGTDGDLSLYESHGTRVGSRTEPCGTDDDVNAPLAAGEYTDEMVARHDTHGASALPVGSTAS